MLIVLTSAYYRYQSYEYYIHKLMPKISPLSAMVC